MRAQHGAQEYVHIPYQLGATREDGLLSLGPATTVTLLISAPRWEEAPPDDQLVSVETTAVTSLWWPLSANLLLHGDP